MARFRSKRLHETTYGGMPTSQCAAFQAHLPVGLKTPTVGCPTGKNITLRWPGLMLGNRSFRTTGTPAASCQEQWPPKQRLPSHLGNLGSKSCTQTGRTVRREYQGLPNIPSAAGSTQKQHSLTHTDLVCTHITIMSSAYQRMCRHR